MLIFQAIVSLKNLFSNKCSFWYYHQIIVTIFKACPILILFFLYFNLCKFNWNQVIHCTQYKIFSPNHIICKLNTPNLCASWVSIITHRFDSDKHKPASDKVNEYYTSANNWLYFVFFIFLMIPISRLHYQQRHAEMWLYSWIELSSTSRNSLE